MRRRGLTGRRACGSRAASGLARARTADRSVAATALAARGLTHRRRPAGTICTRACRRRRRKSRSARCHSRLRYSQRRGRHSEHRERALGARRGAHESTRGGRRAGGVRGARGRRTRSREHFALFGRLDGLLPGVCRVRDHEAELKVPLCGGAGRRGQARGERARGAGGLVWCAWGEPGPRAPSIRLPRRKMRCSSRRPCSISTDENWNSRETARHFRMRAGMWMSRSFRRSSHCASCQRISPVSASDMFIQSLRSAPRTVVSPGRQGAGASSSGRARTSGSHPRWPAPAGPPVPRSRARSPSPRRRAWLGCCRDNSAATVVMSASFSSCPALEACRVRPVFPQQSRHRQRSKRGDARGSPRAWPERRTSPGKTPTQPAPTAL